MVTSVLTGKNARGLAKASTFSVPSNVKKMVGKSIRMFMDVGKCSICTSYYLSPNHVVVNLYLHIVMQ